MKPIVSDEIRKNVYLFTGVVETEQAPEDINLLRRQKIIEIVCEKLCVTEEQLSSKSRLRKFVDARHIAHYFIRKETSLTLAEMGKFTNRDHATIMLSIRKCKDLKTHDFAFGQKFKLVQNSL